MHSTYTLQKRTLIHWLGLLGIASLVSYLLAVVFSPSAYPGYNWMAQAVSDLSALDAPSRQLWLKLSCFYGIGAVVSLTVCCIYIQNRLNKLLRAGIYLFTVMNWVSNLGYTMFPLSTSGYAGTFQDIMHAYVVTTTVVGLSIVSLVLIMIGGYKERKYRSLAIFATIALCAMFIGAIGTGTLPTAYFGVAERFSVFAAAGFTAVLGYDLFLGFDRMEQK